MIKNYLKIAWRNILKNRFYSLVNITGLSVGIAFTLLIGAYALSELQVNRNLKDADNQYIIQSKWKDANQGIELTSFGPLAKELKENYPTLVKNYYRWDGITSNVSKGNKSFREGLQICDSTLFNMYGFTLLHGNPATAFDGPYSLVITTDRAKKYFGTTDVLGQTLTIESFSGTRHDFIITGVMNNPPKNSVTYITEGNDNQFYISTNNISYFGRNMLWVNQYIVSYIELQKGVTTKDLEGPMKHLIGSNVSPQIAANVTSFLAPLKSYYLSANNGLIKKMLYALSGIAFFILLMAVINFVNLSISRSATRIKEIGIRKVVGGLKRQLIFQFLTESIILVFLATLLAAAIAIPVRPIFNNILGKEIPTFYSFPFYFIIFPLLLVCLIGILAGIYPAFILSSAKVVESLKGKLNSIGDKIILRKSLVALQFGTATIVFIGAIIISEQVNLFFSKDIGFDKDYIVSAQVSRNWTLQGVKQMNELRNGFAAMPQVKDVTLSFEVPDGNGSGYVALYKEGADSTTAIRSSVLTTDEYYASTYGIPMAAGEFFSKPGAFTDSSRIVINEKEANSFGWKDPQVALGKRLYFQNGSGPFIVAGVTKNFHFGSMQQAILPVIFLHVGENPVYRFFSFKLKAGNISTSIAALQKKWSVLLPGSPFEYNFMDDTIAKLYKTEIQLQKASYTATALSFVIVLLGVLGLIALAIQKRTKEVGIRKVLGASVGSIISLFLKEFGMVVFISGLIACPVTYIMMNRWLQGYAYRVNITIAPFLIAIIFLALITGILICLQTIKTANANPVKSLRTE